MNNEEDLTIVQDEIKIRKAKRVKNFLFVLLALALAIITAFVSNT